MHLTWKHPAVAGIMLLLSVTTFQLHWGEYLLHLASHQSFVWNHRQPIDEAARNSPPELQKRFELIARIKSFGKELYALESSESYSQYVEIPRETLGWNITAAPALKLEPEEFNFLIGKFSYLGFFDRTLLDKWEARFRKEGLDIHESEVAAYSTLGYLQDPLFSTYLNFSDGQLARIILHEMSHEKLYFRDDSNFSESLSSYIDDVAMKRFLQKEGKPMKPTSGHQLAQAESELFHQAVDELRTQLETIYSSSKPDPEKLALKAERIADFRKQLESMQKKFRYSRAPEWMLGLPEINNAVLVQIKRYSGHRSKAFEELLVTECNEDILCWFDKLEQTKPCSQQERALFLKEEISWKELLEQCAD